MSFYTLGVAKIRIINYLFNLALNNRLINSTIRIGIGKFNTINDIKDAANYILKVVNKLKIKKTIKAIFNIFKIKFFINVFIMKV